MDASMDGVVGRERAAFRRRQKEVDRQSASIH